MDSDDWSKFEQNFCNGTFWNSTLTWDSMHPDFTNCFQRTVLCWVPTLVLLFVGLFEIPSYFSAANINRKIPWSLLNGLKLGATLGLVIVNILEIALIVISNADDDPMTNVTPSDYVAVSIFLFSYTVSFIFLILSLRYGIQTSPTQFLFYFASALCEGINFRSVVRRKTHPEEEFPPISEHNTNILLYLISIQYAFIIVLFISNFFSDKKPQKYDEKLDSVTNLTPEMSASFPAKLTFLWATRLMWKGYKNPLEPSMLWGIDPKMTSRGVVPLLDVCLDQEYEKAKLKNILTEPNSEKLSSKEYEKMKMSILWPLVKTFGADFFIGACHKVFYDLLVMATPQIMGMMITFVEIKYCDVTVEDNDCDEIAQATAYDWKGYFFAGLMFAMTVCQSLILNQYFVRMFKLGMNLKTALISTIYRKALVMSNSARKESTVGEIVNLMSVDVQRFMDLLPYINMIWSAPLQIGLCCYCMWGQIGIASMAGVAVVILAIPINTIIAKITRKLQLAQMKYKDKRIKLMNEILSGMKVIKLYGWEPSFSDQTQEIRNKEMKVLKKSAGLNAITMFIWTSVPFLMAVASFTVYVLIKGGQVLTADRAFVTLTYLNIIRMPAAMLPFIVVSLVQAKVSLDRLNKYMNNDELNTKAVGHDTSIKEQIRIQNGKFKWGKDDPDILKDINFFVKPNSLTAVVGTVGAGKSSLISACLGEMEKVSGTVNVKGKIGYVPQQAWMQNASLKNNILFGKAYEKNRYENILDACALRPDLDILPGGDETEIGEKGINLSGGQKQRVSLARAVYSQSDLLLLDDPLSAVDSHVGKHIFQKVIGPEGLLRKTTRVLVTHGIGYLPQVDDIIVLKDGRISEQGTYQELLKKKGDFADFLLEYMTEQEDDLNEEFKQQLMQEVGAEHVSALKQSELSVSETKLMEKNSQIDSVAEKNAGNQSKAITQKAGTKLIETEKAEVGRVSYSVYFWYMRNLGWPGLLIVIMTFLYQGSQISTSIWLTIWTDEALGPQFESVNNDPNDLEPTKWLNIYIGVYGAFGGVQAVAVVILTVVLAFTTLRASRIMHNEMLHQVLRSPMSFFDTTPLGRIVNRFAKDIDVCDNMLPQNIRQWMSCFANFMGTVVTITVFLPIFIVVIVPASIIFFFVQTVYVSTSRQLKRLESISRSPIYSHFSETLTGATTIRAFGMNQEFITESERKVDFNNVCYYPSIIGYRWLSILLENTGNLVTFGAAIFAVLAGGSVEPGQVGLIISYALNVTAVLTWLVRTTADVETNIVAVERIKEYSDLPSEACWDNHDQEKAFVSTHQKSSEATAKTSTLWPYSGRVSFEKYAMRYRDGLDLVLKSITCEIEGGEKIGIVGRTGAGKSSLTMALFRLVEAAAGKITIDGKDTAKMGLHNLRTRVTIIPQDPVLFSGTLRMNLDPFNVYTDEQVWSALKLSHLHDFVSSLEKGLLHYISEGGDNLSVGQRQLVCLARALLKKTKILVLDEATAAVDLETDDLIQATIRKEFKDSTVLTIAHRLNTIMDYDRVMVLDQGNIAEFDSVDTLLKNHDGIFHSMAKNAGLLNNNITNEKVIDQK